MTATDELRRLLDERGVEYTDRDMFGKRIFHWGEPLHGAMFTDACEWTELVIENASPAQAVEAMLGREKCRIEERQGEWHCTGCGEMVGDSDPWSELYINGNAIELWNYCPNCGRKVAE